MLRRVFSQLRKPVGWGRRRWLCSDVYQTLEERGFIQQSTHPDELRAHLQKKPRVVYAGFDPTAPSLHIGNLLVLMGLNHFRLAGHQPIAVVGGATGLIGDPSGKNSDRDMLTRDTVLENVEGIASDIRCVLPNVQMYNNLDTYREMTAIDFLRDIGKSFRVTEMMRKQSVQDRLESPAGISYTEFSYQVLQAYDFWHLNQQYGCSVQIGGSDQWGNITAGTDLIRRLGTDQRSYGLTIPLLLTAKGEKFGKSAMNVDADGTGDGGGVWMSPERTSAYQCYQYFLQTYDADVEKFLGLFTLLDMSEVREISAEHRADPKQQLGQKTLAEHVTRLLHGDAGLEQALGSTASLYGGGDDDVSLEEKVKRILAASQGVPQVEMDASFVSQCNAQLQTAPTEGIVRLSDLTVTARICKSRSECVRLIKNGGLYLNNERVTSPGALLSDADFVGGELCQLRVGKKRHYLFLDRR